MTDKTTEKREFQAEVRQLLDIVIHSLYTDREVFVRELVSNAADALEKLRHLQLVGKEVFDDKLGLEINITTDDTAGTVTIQDFGAGMTRAELVENIGTIAHSGSKAFLKALQEAKGGAGDIGQKLIGQFGVGFYSAFMVAKRVSLYTHSWEPEAEHLLWTSDGAGSYEIETVEGQRRGCKLVVFLKDDAKEFAKADAMRGILTRYSNFVPFPINLNGQRLNTVQALWLRGKSEIKEEEYKEFYKFQADAMDEPLFWLHFSADAPLAINALLFTPKDNPERWGFGRFEPRVSLYCRKVLIDARPAEILPEWLRFLRGVVDSADLPLNISREKMQDSALVRKLNQVLTNRFIKSLEEEAKKRPEKFDEFYQAFGVFLKEGIVSDLEHREKLAKLLRFESTVTEPGKAAALEDYVKRMREAQKEIYYLFGPKRETLVTNPCLEAFAARNLEVLFLFDPLDEFVMSHLREFEGKRLVSADQGDIKLEDVPAEGEPLGAEESKKLCEWMKGQLGGKISAVSAGQRLVKSPAVALNDDRLLTPAMRRMMKAMHQDVEETPSLRLEINPRHALIKNLDALRGRDEPRAILVAGQICDNALLAAGFLDDPRRAVERVYQLLEIVAGK